MRKTTQSSSSERSDSSAAAAPETARGYASLSTQPLHILIFLLPWLLIAEVGSLLVLPDGQGITQEILAHRLLNNFFQTFGVSSFHLPALALVVVLLVQHILSKHSWKIRARVLAGMATESAFWVLPLIVLAQLLSTAKETQSLQEGATSVRDLPWQSLAMIALEAGLYEELLFRFVLITLLHLLLVDLLHVKRGVGSAIAIAVAAVAFALYHNDMSGMAFYLLSGVYFGTLFLWRGFGIVVVVHAMYDLVALLGPGAAAG